MTVKDYANESGFSIQEVLEKCKELDIKVSSGNDYLDEDGIIMLDNTMNLISTETELDYNDADELDEAVENIMLDSKLQAEEDNNTKKREKVKKKTVNEKDKNDYLKNKKAMYKNKEKLSNNAKDENVVLYKDGMTLGDLAKELEVDEIILWLTGYSKEELEMHLEKEQQKSYLMSAYINM